MKRIRKTNRAPAHQKHLSNAMPPNTTDEDYWKAVEAHRRTEFRQYRSQFRRSRTRQWMPTYGYITPLAVEWFDLTDRIEHLRNTERQRNSRIWWSSGDHSKPVPQTMRPKVARKLNDMQLSRVLVASKIARAKYRKGMDRQEVAHLKLSIMLRTDLEFGRFGGGVYEWTTIQIPAVESALSFLKAARKETRKRR